MKNDNKVCICCRTSYKYCNTCAEYANLPQWMNIYDKIECKVMFDVATDYIANKITKDEAKEKLSNYDIANISVKESVKKVLDEILCEDVEKYVEKIAEPKAEQKEETVTDKVTPEKKHIFNNKKK